MFGSIRNDESLLSAPFIFYFSFMKKLLSLLFISVALVSCGKQVTVEPQAVVPEVTVEQVAVQQPSTYSFVPPVQPSIHGTREENNKILWKHLKDSDNAFIINNLTSNIVRFAINKELRCDRDILIGINGKSMGVLHKNLNCQFMSDTERDEERVIVMPLDNIQVVQNGVKKTLNLFDYMNQDGVVNFSFAIGMTDNFVTLIEVE